MVSHLAANQTLLHDPEAQSDDALITTSRDNLILSWNGGAETMSGYRSHEVIGKNIGFIYPDKHRKVDSLNVRDALSGIVVRNSVVKAQRKDGAMVSLIYTLVPMRDQAGQVIGILRICKDISAFKTAQVALRRALTQLRQMDQVQDGFLQAVAGGIDARESSVESFVTDTEAEGRRSHREFLQIIAEECRHLGSQLDDILNELRQQETALQ